MLDRWRRWHLIAAAAFFAGGVFTFFYRGPGWHFTRGTLDDVMVVGFMFHLLSLAWRGPLWMRAGGIALVALATELAQGAHLIGSRRGLFTELVTGSTFDYGDLAAYAVGLSMAVAVERWGRLSTN